LGSNTVVIKRSAGLISPAEIGFYRWLMVVPLLTLFKADFAGLNRPFMRAMALVQAEDPRQIEPNRGEPS
jgi:hypothetical protein